MTYSVPAVYTGSAFTTNAVALTSTTHTLVAAPGVTSAFRVAQVIATVDADVTPGSLLQLFFRDSTPTGFGRLVISDTQPIAIWEPLFPGRLLGANTSLQIVSTCSNPAQGFRIDAYYFVDQVS